MTAPTLSLAIARPRLIPLLSVVAGALLAAYIALMVAAILFAALQTELAQGVQDKRMAITKLESAYYASVAQLDATDPHTLGYVTPKRVQYVAASALPNLTFAR